MDFSGYYKITDPVALWWKNWIANQKSKQLADLFFWQQPWDDLVNQIAVGLLEILFVVVTIRFILSRINRFLK